MTRKEFLAFGVFAVATVFGIVGLIKTLASHAATPATDVEAEAGTVASVASKVTDSTASGGSAVKFGVPTGTNWPALPNYPTVKYTDLYVSGETLITTLNKVQQGYIVELPNGFDYEISHDPMLGPENANMLMYFPKIRGFIGAGPDKSRFRIKPNRYGVNFTTMRLMDGRNGQNVNAGWTLAGTDQLPILHAQSAVTHPANTSGFMLYYGRDAVFQNMKFMGFQGDWNSPPGETFQLNLFKDINTKMYGVEVDGHNLAGAIVGGSPVGMNNSTNAEYHDCYFHDAYVSAPTASFAGTWDEAKSSSGWKTFNCRFHRNANWNVFTRDGYSYGTGGKRMAGINHENVYGTIVHDHPNFITANATLFWDNGHMAFSHHLYDNPDITIIEPTWDRLHADTSGAFVVGGFGPLYGGEVDQQKTPPKVTKNGVQLQPYFFDGNPPGPLPINPATQFLIYGPDRR